VDSFAKRLASQEIPGPAPATTDQERRFRWGIAGSYLPGIIAQGAIAASLGGLGADLVGEFTSPPPPGWLQSDRWGVEGIPTPGDISQRDRWVISEAFLFEGDNIDTLGAVSVVLGSLAADLQGAFSAVAVRNGNLEPTLGALDATFVSQSYYDLWYDISWSLTPTFTLQVLPKRDGVVTPTLGGLVTSVLGTVLPPDSTTGAIEGALSSLDASFAGSFTLAAARDGNIHIDLGSMLPQLRGSFVAFGGALGSISATLGSLSADFLGVVTTSESDGDFQIQLGALQPSWYGQSFDAGTIVGFIPGQLGSLSASFRGLVVEPAPTDLAGTVRIVIRPEAGDIVVSSEIREFKV
jgi:hypothetical protein